MACGSGGAAGDRRRARDRWCGPRGGGGTTMPVRPVLPPRLLVRGAAALSAACPWLVKVLLR